MKVNCMSKIFTSAGLIAFFCLSVAMLAHSAEEKPVEPAAEQTAVKEEAASQTTLLPTPEEAMNPDTYVKLITMAKDWLITNGPGIIVAIIILIVGRWLAMWFASIGKKAMAKGGVDETLARFLSKLLYYSLLAAVVIAAADQIGIKTTSFIAILGAAGLAIGLALKDSLANFASGVMLILLRPFKVGDAVTAGGVSGKVQQVDIFSTVVLTPDNQRQIIPNSKITSDVITNVTAEPTRRIDLVIGIGYDDDIALAKTTLEELVSGDDRVLADPAPTIAVANLGASSIDLIVRPWVKTGDYWDVRLDLTEKIKLTFDEKNISIPYPQQDVHMYQHSAD